MGVPSRHDFWLDRLNLPAYRVGEAASYVGSSPQQIAYWEKTGEQGQALSKRAERAGVSYLQLIEISVVSSMRKAGVKLQAIRDARKYFSKRLGLEFPFAQAKFKTDGAEILTEIEGSNGEALKDKLLSASANGQLVWSDVLQGRFEQFDYSENGLVVRFHPRKNLERVVIDPSVSLGAPSVEGVPTWVIRERWLAGETLADIVDDFVISFDSVVEALKFEDLEVGYDRPGFAA